MATHTDLQQQRSSSAEAPALPASQEQSTLGVPHLKRLWHKAQLEKQGKLEPAIKQQEWGLDLALIDELKLGLEPALTALYQCAELSEFEAFVLDKNQGQISPAVIARMQRALEGEREPRNGFGPDEGPLSAQQVQFWEQSGYIVVPAILSPAECQAALREIEQATGVSMAEPDSWYSPEIPRQKIMVQYFNGALQERIRHKESIRQVFAQLWHTDQLAVTTDRISINPPETAEWKFPGPGMHWDMEHFTPPIPFRTQGLIYLTDTAENQGAFSCVPGFHHQIDRFLTALPPEADPQVQDWSTFEVKPISANAGDLIIWHHALPHGSSPNHAQSPRVVQYINMYPL